MALRVFRRGFSRLISPFSLYLVLDGGTLTEGGTAAAAFDVAHSIYWGGISSVTFNGDSVPYDLTSLSGFDWTQSQIPTNSVPEPNSLLLLASGLAGIASFACRRRAGR